MIEKAREKPKKEDVLKTCQNFPPTSKHTTDPSPTGRDWCAPVLLKVFRASWLLHDIICKPNFKIALDLSLLLVGTWGFYGQVVPQFSLHFFPVSYKFAFF